MENGAVDIVGRAIGMMSEHRHLARSSAVVNVDCCKQCFEKHGSFADASWAMGDFMRKVFAPVAA